MTLMLLEGRKWELIYNESKELPDPETVHSEDEKALFRFLRE